MQVIVEKMVEYLRSVTDDVAKADVVQRIGDLAERYAPDTQWFIDTMNQVARCLATGFAAAGVENAQLPPPAQGRRTIF